MRLITLLLVLLATPLKAHEFWIEPDAYQIDRQTKIVADIVNGQDFSGQKLAYLPQRFEHFVMFHDGQAANVPGRIGDTPGLQMDPMGDGLHIAAYQARNATVGYAEWQKFQNFVDHKDFGDVRSLHDARGLPADGFTEVYSRYAKTLIGVGDAAGADRRTGLETEIVALTNPYTEDTSAGMQLQVFYRQETRPETQVEVFEKAPNGSVSVTFYRTNAEGIATVQVKPGYAYMADAVVLREPTASLAADTGAVWETLWANLTWGVPAR